MSYNPSLKDHQALLQEIAKDEMKLIKEEKHIERVTTKMFKKVSPETKEVTIVLCHNLIYKPFLSVQINIILTLKIFQINIS